MSEWKKTTIGAQITLQRGIDITRAEQREGIIPVVSSSGISSFHNTAAAQGPGVILGRKGVVGSVWFVDCDYWPHDTTLWVKDFKGNNPRFVYYFFKSRAEELASMDTGSANPTLNRNHVHPIEIIWPDKIQQDRIAGILGSLDDKIQVLQKQNQILENLISLQFDDEIVGQKWDEKPLDQIATYLNGLALQKFPPNAGGNLNVIKIRELNQGITDSTEICGCNVPPEYIVDSGDILFSWSGSLQVILWAFGKGALNQHLFKVTSTIYPKWFVYLATKYHLLEFRQIAESKATTMGHIQRRHLAEAKIACPPPNMIKSLNEKFSPSFEKIISNNDQINTLTKLSATLLHKLMSGEVRLNA